MDVWSQGPAVLQKTSIRPGNFGDLVKALISTCDRNTIELFAFAARNIWHRRNLFIFENSFIHPCEVMQTAKKSQYEFKAAQPKLLTPSQGMIAEDWHWKPPPPGVTKINWDAGLNEGQGRAGFGLVARDSQGNVIASKKFSRPSLFDPLLAEAQGALYAVDLAIDLGCSSIILEGDSLSIVKCLEQPVDRWDRVGMILNDTKSKLSGLVSWEVIFVKRAANVFAHQLAKAALSIPEELVAFVVSPDSLDVVTSDDV
ncbi:uncharacterized protein LOC118343962 [Juglans regia]|uniref:Uncharacterized protein LOC118343962 n=1 Tax=Juglans regia TaxID=51240 RepID=A0A6P9DUT3_JUGRE|nr:uncharacterized protein LOC118343962 [Juglans regia]